jgi:hypothetical protein
VKTGLSSNVIYRKFMYKAQWGHGHIKKKWGGWRVNKSGGGERSVSDNLIDDDRPERDDGVDRIPEWEWRNSEERE